VCCRAFLQGFAPVSIRMAKDQNLALNPGKLSGICGRLKCCLVYEHSLYSELRKGMPKVGSHVTTAQGIGIVRAQSILDQTVQVGLETGGQVALKAAEVTVRPRPEPPPKAKTPRAQSRPRGESRPQAARPPAPGGNGDAPPDVAALED
jgi:hypothetical protein